MKKTRVFDSPDDLPKDRSSLLAISNKFGLTFVGLDKKIKVYHTRDILAADKVDGNSNEISKNVLKLVIPSCTVLAKQRLLMACLGQFDLISTFFSTSYSLLSLIPFLSPLVEGIAALTDVPVELPVHNLGLSSDELTLSVSGMSEESGLSLDFYDVRTFINKVIN